MPTSSFLAGPDVPHVELLDHFLHCRLFPMLSSTHEPAFPCLCYLELGHGVEQQSRSFLSDESLIVRQNEQTLDRDVSECRENLVLHFPNYHLLLLPARCFSFREVRTLGTICSAKRCS